MLDQEQYVYPGGIGNLPRDCRVSSSWAKRKSETESQSEGANPRIRLVTKPEMVKWVRKFFT